MPYTYVYKQTLLMVEWNLLMWRLKHLERWTAIKPYIIGKAWSQTNPLVYMENQDTLIIWTLLIYLNQAPAGHRPAGAWFKQIRK